MRTFVKRLAEKDKLIESERQAKMASEEENKAVLSDFKDKLGLIEQALLDRDRQIERLKGEVNRVQNVNMHLNNQAQHNLSQALQNATSNANNPQLVVNSGQPHLGDTHLKESQLVEVVDDNGRVTNVAAVSGILLGTEGLSATKGSQKSGGPEHAADASSSDNRNAGNQGMKGQGSTQERPQSQLESDVASASRRSSNVGHSTTNQSEKMRIPAHFGPQATAQGGGSSSNSNTQPQSTTNSGPPLNIGSQLQKAPIPPLSSIAQLNLQAATVNPNHIPSLANHHPSLIPVSVPTPSSIPITGGNPMAFHPSQLSTVSPASSGSRYPRSASRRAVSFGGYANPYYSQAVSNVNVQNVSGQSHQIGAIIPGPGPGLLTPAQQQQYNVNYMNMMAAQAVQQGQVPGVPGHHHQNQQQIPVGYIRGTGSVPTPGGPPGGGPNAKFFYAQQNSRSNSNNPQVHGHGANQYNQMQNQAAAAQMSFAPMTRSKSLPESGGSLGGMYRTTRGTLVAPKRRHVSPGR